MDFNMIPLKVLCRLPVSRDRGSAGPTFFQKKVGDPDESGRHFRLPCKPPQAPNAGPAPPQACFIALFEGALKTGRFLSASLCLPLCSIFDHTRRQKRNQRFPSDEPESRICALPMDRNPGFAVEIGSSQMKMSSSMIFNLREKNKGRIILLFAALVNGTQTGPDQAYR